MVSCFYFMSQKGVVPTWQGSANMADIHPLPTSKSPASTIGLLKSVTLLVQT